MKPVLPAKADHPPRPKGRPRKVPLGTDSPKGLTAAQKSKIIQSKNAAIRYQKGKIANEIARRIGDGEDPNHVRKDIFTVVSAKYLDAKEDVPASIKELKIGDMTLSGEPAKCTSSPIKLLSGKKQFRKNPSCGSEPADPEYLPSIAAHTQTIPMNFGFASTCIIRSSDQVSTPSLKKLSHKDSEKVDLVPRSKKSFGLTYDEQSNLIIRDNCGFFVGADALRARTPGQKGRSRKCRIAIFRSARLLEFSWFREEIMIPLGDRDPNSVCHESGPGPRALSPCLPLAATATREQTPPFAESPKLSPPENDCANTPKSGHISPSSDLDELSKNGSTRLDVINQICMPDLAACNNSHVTSFIEKNMHATIQPGYVSLVPEHEKYCNLVGLSPNISPFMPINPSHSKFSEIVADGESPLHIDIEELIPLEVSKSQASHSKNASAEEQTMSLHKSPDIDMPPAPIIENSPRSYAQTEVHEVVDGLTQIQPTSIAQTSPALDAILPVPCEVGTDAYGETTQTGAHVQKPVTISGGSISIIRKKIIMDIIHMCGGIYSGHKELSGPFATAWARQNKPGKPDSKTIYTAFRSLVQSGKLRELKFSFQTPKGLMVTKSMITLTSIAPTDSRVIEMQNLIIACHPSPYIPEGVEILEEVRNPPAYPSRFRASRTIEDLEIDNDSQVRLQHKPLYVTRLEERKTAVERSRQIRQARLEARRVKHERRIQRAGSSVSLWFNH